MPKKQRVLTLIPCAIPLLLTVGCSNSDERLARFAEQATERQAEQNRRMADLQQEVAEGSRKLVEADAASRQEFTKLQQHLQSERTEIAHQRDTLEEERREIASQRVTDPLIAAALMNAGLLIACVLPLVLCWYLLRSSDTDTVDSLVTDVLLKDLVAEQPLLLVSPPQRRLMSGPQFVPGKSPANSDPPEHPS